MAVGVVVVEVVETDHHQSRLLLDHRARLAWLCPAMAVDEDRPIPGADSGFAIAAAEALAIAV